MPKSLPHLSDLSSTHPSPGKPSQPSRLDHITLLHAVSLKVHLGKQRPLQVFQIEGIQIWELAAQKCWGVRTRDGVAIAGNCYRTWGQRPNRCAPGARSQGRLAGARMPGVLPTGIENHRGRICLTRDGDKKEMLLLEEMPPEAQRKRKNRPWLLPCSHLPASPQRPPKGPNCQEPKWQESLGNLI